MTRLRISKREWRMAAMLLIPIVFAAIVALMLIRPPGSAAEAVERVDTTNTRNATPPPPAALAARIASLGRSFNGDVGISLQSVDHGWSAEFNGARTFPQQSVRKLWVAVTILDQVDRGVLSLDQPVMLTPASVTVFHQPIRKRMAGGPYRSTIAELLTYALTQSDNLANDMLLRSAGGKTAIAETIASKRLHGITFGPRETELQSAMAGLVWNDGLSQGRAFWQARDRVPTAIRARALGRYLATPPDGATPIAITAALARLARGELLSPASSDYLLALMAQSKTGPERLRGAIREGSGWMLAHKTGTGQVMGDFATAYNDVGLLRSPAGRTFAIAVMIGSTRASVKERQALMQAVVASVMDCDAMGANCGR